MNFRQTLSFSALAGLLVALTATAATAAELLIGAGSVDITPDRPVPLDGHRSLRVSNKIESHVTANVLALESRDQNQMRDQAIIVSWDLVGVRDGILDKVREKLKGRLADFDSKKLFIGATHTHNAPVTVEGRYTLPESGIIKPAEYAEFLTSKVADTIVETWQKRQAGKVTWGQGQAVVAQNRRPLFADGTAKMYGDTKNKDFRGIEGYEDHNLEALYFFDAKDQLFATLINVACPAQEAEGGLALHADFWHPIRQSLHERHGQDLVILGLPGAGGDQTSRPQYGKAADERMRKLRGLTRLQEVARRVVNGWEDTYEAVRKDLHADVPLRHCVKEIELPYRQVTEAEVEEARKEAAKYANIPAQRWNYLWHQSVVSRYEAQKAGTEGNFKMELHALRLGDIAIASNTFELYTDYGVQLKARSPAVQTFIMQLTGSGGYLPTERAVHGGGYGAVIQSSRIGPNGGQSLVDQTLQALDELWKN